MKINREELLKRLEAVAPGLTQKEVIEQSSCLVFDEGRVMTFDDEVACSIDVPLKVTGAVQGSNLLTLLRKMKEDDVEVTAKDGELQIKGRGRRSGIRMEAEVLLPVEAIETPNKWKKLPEDFIEAVGIVGGAVSTDESQWDLTCVHIHPEWVEATDNFQISRYPLKTRLKESWMVRQKALKHIMGTGMNEFSETESWVHFRNPTGLVLSCRRYEKKYPDLTGYLNVKGTKTVLPGGLAEALDKAQIFSSENSDVNQVQVSLRPGRIELRGEGPNGWYVERQKTKYDGEPLSFNILPRLLLEITKRAKECVVAEGRLKVDTGKFVYLTCTGKTNSESEDE